MWPELIYIAGARPLPLIPWNPRKPAFHVRELTENDAAESIRRQFTLPWAYSLCSHEWEWSGLNAWDHPDTAAEELEAWDESRRQLAEYVAGVVGEFGAIELYASNPGWEGRPVHHVSCVRTDKVRELIRWLQSDHYAIVRPGPQRAPLEHQDHVILRAQMQKFQTKFSLSPQEREEREHDQEVARRARTDQHNEGCRRFWALVQETRWVCPNCLRNEFRLSESDDHRSFVICRFCGAAFAPTHPPPDLAADLRKGNSS